MTPERTLAACALAACALLLGCKPTEELEACNIARPECQQSIYYGLLRMRGDGYDPFLGVPPIRTLTVEQYEAELRGPMPAPMTTTKDPDEMEMAMEPMEPMEPAPVDPWDVALRLLRLVQPTVSTKEARVQDRVSHVAAFYSSRTRTVTVIDRGGMRNDRADTLLLLHELVHAMQDDEIGGWDGSTKDGDFAARAMIEGEATLYENLASLELDGLTVDDADWDGFYGNWIDRRRGAMRTQRSPYYATGWFVYPLGGELLTKAYMQGGNAAVRQELSHWPESSVELMAAHEGMEPPPHAPFACGEHKPTKDFRTVDDNRFGALQAYGFLIANGMDEAHAWELSLGLSSDDFGLYLDEDAREVGVSWRIRLADAQAASAAALELLGAAGFHAQARGRDVLVRGASPIELLDEWPEETPDCE